ncbi:hypothetical protein LCGC14_1479500 [marine sediment metagenome]|uniref:DUF5679 domain-containing protein n=1 Tax=marine sediment metagenome TaxID=412755 RepID=A0A0F9LQB1_9ZZZZ
MVGYCFKCQAPCDMSAPQPVTLKNGRPASQGTCPKCGQKVVRLGRAA